MRLSTNKWLCTGAVTIALSAAVYLLGFTELLTVAPSGPVRAGSEKPAAKKRPPRRPSAAPKSLLPKLEAETELVIIAETPILWSAPVPAPVTPAPKIQYFGTTAEEVRLADPRIHDWARTVWGAGTDPIHSALAALAAVQSEDGSTRDSGRELDVHRTALALWAWARDKIVRGSTEFDANAERAATWLVGQQDSSGMFRGLDGLHDYALTALALLALEASKLQQHEAQVKLARQALAQQELRSGGWPARLGGGIDVFTTLLVMEAGSLSVESVDAAIKALGSSRGHTALRLWGATVDQQCVDQASMLLRDRCRDKQWMDSVEYIASQNTLSAQVFDWSNGRCDMLLWWLLGQRIAQDTIKHREALKRLWHTLATAQANGRWTSSHAATLRLKATGTTALGALTLLSLLEGSSKAAAEREQGRTADRDDDGAADAADHVQAAKHQSGPGWLRQRGTGLLLPLKHTDVAASISGIVASTRVTQTFTNPYDSAIEAVYCFPLPHGAAVTDFEMRVGTRRIRGVIRPRADAEQMYAQALAAGHTTALLTRETGGIFNHQVGNIAPAARVDIELTFFDRVSFVDNRFEWVFPMVVGPFYVPGAAQPSNGGLPGSGVSPDTDQAPNASRITPPTLPQGVRSGHDISLVVDLDAGFPIVDAVSVTHAVSTDVAAPGQRVIRLSRSDNIANRDFVLRWTVGAPPGGSVLMAHKPTSDAPGWFCLLLNPAQSGIVRAGGDVVFVVDVSGSMNGQPLSLSKRLLTEAIQALSPGDRFNVVTFASGTAQLFHQPEFATPANVKKGLAMIAGLTSGGGTEMLDGLKTAVNDRRLRGEPCQFVFLTDGYVANIKEILNFVHANSDSGEFCAFGIGNAVNRELIDGVAAASNGRAVYCLPRDSEATSGAAAAFHQFLRTKPTPEIKLDWNDLPVADITPGNLGLIQAGTTVALFGRYQEEAEGVLRLSAADRADWLVNLELPGVEERNPGVRALWAQCRLAEMQQDLDADPHARKARLDAISAFAAGERLATPWTTFIAIDEESRPAGTRPRKIVQPVELPEGVDHQGTGR